MPVWAWVAGGLVVVGIILGVVIYGVYTLVSRTHPIKTPLPSVTATETLQPVKSDTPILNTATPTLAGNPTATPFPPVVLRNNANVRAGPGTVYPVLAVFTAGKQVEIVGRNHAGNWLACVLPGNQQGWISVNSLQVDFDINLLAELAALPEPTLAPLPPTATPQSGVPAASATPTPAPP
jgi:hypothetical protein